MAIRLAPNAAAGPAMTAAVTTILSNPAFAANAKRLQAAVAGVDGAAGAADAIIDYLQARDGNSRRVANAAA
jgi:UDP:flavonoid glycosyltransferase YjiC (YdhE family)